MCGFGLLLLICLLCPTSMLAPTVVVVGSPTVARAAEVHGWPVFPSLLQMEQSCSAGDTVAGGPVYSSLSSLASVVGGSCCCQSHTDQPASTTRCVLPSPSCPWRCPHPTVPLSGKVSGWGALRSLVARGPGEVYGGVLALLCAITYICVCCLNC